MPLRCDPFADMSGPLTLVDQVSVLNPDTPIDLANVRVEMGGGVASRPGTAELGNRTPSDAGDSIMFSTAGGSDRLLIQEDDLLVALDMTGAIVGSGQAITGNLPVSFARYGAPGTERVYYADGDDIGYFDGTSFTANPAGLPHPRVWVTTPWDNRLMGVGYTDTTSGPSAGAGSSSPSSAHYSDELTPTGFDDTQRVVLTPGDGEELVAGVTWRDRTFLFKQSRFFVVYGTIDVGGGIPDLQYYVVDAQVGVEGPLAVCAGRDGVYFVNRQGVYMTRGEEPVLLSQGLDPIFRGLTATYWSGRVADPADMHEASICWFDERLYVGLPTLEDGRVTLVYDPRTQWWGYDTMPVVDATPALIGGTQVLAFAPAGGGIVRYHADSLTKDLGEDFLSYWRSGWHDFGSPDVKALRHSRVLGSGRAGLRYSVDGGALLPGGDLRMNVSTDTWGDGSGPDKWSEGNNPADKWGQGRRFVEAWCRKVPVRGRRYSWEFRGLGPWSVQQVDHHVSVPSRKPAVDLTANA